MNYNIKYYYLILLNNCTGNCFTFMKKYVKRMQIRHTYGDDEADDDDMCEESALQITEAAVSTGRAPAAPVIQEFAAPEGAVVTLGGKTCKWCGSKSHVRKTHKDCPFNPKNKEGNQ